MQSKRRLTLISFSLLLCFQAFEPGWAAEPAAAAADSDEAEASWKELERGLKPPPVPPEWGQREPAPKELHLYYDRKAEQASRAADQARKFYNKFPDHPNADRARDAEYEMLETAVMLGLTNRIADLEKLDQAALAKPSLDQEEKFEIRVRSLQHRAMSKQRLGQAAILQEMENGIRGLLKDFPEKPEIYELLLEIAENSPLEKAKALALEVSQSKAPEETRTEAQALGRRLGLIGKPLSLKFTALDGREIDASKLKGKVVLLDFWATWCGPCVAELPNVLEAYRQLHPQGFEIIGISLDREKPKLEKFVAQRNIAWPQAFDGEAWDSKLASEFGIVSIPTMMLVDKMGNIRDIDARKELVEKAKALLKEP